MDLKSKIRVIEGFPVEGISFKDITTLLKDKDALRVAVDSMCAVIEGDVDIIVGPEARGFIFGTAVAFKLGVGFVPIRKKGKLPGETEEYTYDLEYGSDTIQIHKDAIADGQRVAIVDDLLATGGTLFACSKLVEKVGGIVTNVITLIELEDLKGREKLKDYTVKSIIEYDK
jgi:adenine phosphoribosyltransferase